MPSFSLGLERALHEALNLARERRHEFSTLEHLLLAMLNEKSTIDVLEGCGVDIEALRSDLQDFIDHELDSLVVTGDQEARPTAAFQRVVQRAVIHVQSSGREEVSGANVIIAIFAERESHAAYFLEQQDMSRLDAVNFISHGITKSDEIVDRNRTKFDELGKALYAPPLLEALDGAVTSARASDHAEILPEHVLYELLSPSTDERIRRKSGMVREARSSLLKHLAAVPAQSKRAGRWPVISPALAMALQAALLKAAGEGRTTINASEVFDALAPISAVTVIAPPRTPEPEPVPAANKGTGPTKEKNKPTGAVEALPTTGAPANAAPRKVGAGFTFVSYATADRPLVAMIVALLNQRGIATWWDQDILPGESWRDTISTKLDTCKAHLVLWTATSVKSNPVREEAARGQRAGKMVHAVLDDSRLPFGFSETQYIALKGWDGTTLNPVVESLVQAIIDKLAPPTRSELKARLSTNALAAAMIVNGQVAVVDAPPGVAPPVRDAADLTERLRAQRYLADTIFAELTDREKHNLPGAVPRCVARYQQALSDTRPCWYLLDDAMSAIAHCREQYAQEPWPGTTAHDIGTLQARHAELEPLVRPRQPANVPVTPSGGPFVAPQKVQDVTLTTVVEAARQGIQAGEDAQLLDPSVGRAAAHYSRRLEDALLEAGGTDKALERRQENARAGLRGLGTLLTLVTDALSEGLRSKSVKSSPVAGTVLKRLNAALDAVLNFFRP